MGRNPPGAPSHSIDWRAATGLVHARIGSPALWRRVVCAAPDDRAAAEFAAFGRPPSRPPEAGASARVVSRDCRVTGGIVEDTLYRGYAIERLATITRRRWLGATISVVAFGLAHIPAWGIGFALGADLRSELS